MNAIDRMSWQTLVSVLPDALAFSNHAQVALVDAIRVGDPEATRTVYTAIVVLALLGVGLVALAIWVFRRTRPEPELLAPLEMMQTRGWRKLDPAAQRRSLDDSRPAGASPRRREASEPPVDSSFATVAPVVSFDDLSGEGVGGESSPVPDEPQAGAETDGGQEPETEDDRAIDDPLIAVDETEGSDVIADEDDGDGDGDDADDPVATAMTADRPEDLGTAVPSVDDTEEIDDEFTALLDVAEDDDTEVVERRVDDGEFAPRADVAIEDAADGAADDDGSDDQDVERLSVARSIDPLLASRPLPSERST